MASPLLEPLSQEQTALLRLLGKHFVANATWPMWQYADLSLDAVGLDAADILASLPSVGDRAHSYGLIWRTDASLQPRPDARVAVTVAGLRHVTEFQPLMGSFTATIRYLIDRHRHLKPSPDRVVEATVTSSDIGDQLLSAPNAGTVLPPIPQTMAVLRELLTREPFLGPGLNRPNSVDWEVKVPAILREYSGVKGVDDYIERVTELVSPPEAPSVPLSFSALDVPYAIGYLDAVWKSRTDQHLFVNLDPASIARLTQPCSSAEQFDSLMSALADVLGQVVTPGQAAPRQSGALECVRNHLIIA
jgi:hypothetical protein